MLFFWNAVVSSTMKELRLLNFRDLQKEDFRIKPTWTWLIFEKEISQFRIKNAVTEVASHPKFKGLWKINVWRIPVNNIPIASAQIRKNSPIDISVLFLFELEDVVILNFLHNTRPFFPFLFLSIGNTAIQFNHFLGKRQNWLYQLLLYCYRSSPQVLHSGHIYIYDKATVS